MKKTLCVMLLSLLIMPCAYAGTVDAVDSSGGSMAHFKAVRSYENSFLDVASDAWYYGNVKTLYELGLTEGQSDGLFAPAAPVTVQELVVFSARTASLYTYGDTETGASLYYNSKQGWDSGYLGYVTELGLMNEQLGDRYHEKATRAEAAHFLANTLPDGVVAPINQEIVDTSYAQKQAISDVTEYTPYQQDILSLYRFGLSEGNDSTGSFSPDTTITRSELAALLTRLTTPSLRLTIDWTTFHSAKDVTYGDLAEYAPLISTHAATDFEAARQNLQHIFSKEENILTIYIKNLTKSSVDTLLNTYLKALQGYLEQGYNAINCTYSQSSGKVVLRLYSSLYSDKELPAIREETLAAAIDIHDRLWENGLLTDSMTEYEMAKVYYTYLCDHTVYDNSANDTSLSHTAHSLFTRGLAVCDGYTAAYNMLLKMEGIDCTTYLTADHVWTVATLDGVTCHIDLTWGDQITYVDYSFFAMTPSESLKRFP